MILYVAIRTTLVLETEKFDLKSQVYCLLELYFFIYGESHQQRSLAAYSPWGHKQ